MQSILISVALAASAFSSLGNAAVAAVHNNCGAPMYLWSVGDVMSERVEIPNKMTIYNETYRARSNLGGISIKISGSDTLSSNQTQFEYTIASSNVWYDISNVDGNALSNVDYVLEPSDPDCPVVHCAAQDMKCKEVYNKPDDDHATHACDINSDLTFTLCPEKPGIENPSSGGDSATTSAPKANAAVDTSQQADVVVNADGTVTANDAPAPSSSSPPEAGGRVTGTTPSDQGEITYVTFHNPPTKRSEQQPHQHQHRAHEHTHQRIRRSRIFRRD